MLNAYYGQNQPSSPLSLAASSLLDIPPEQRDEDLIKRLHSLDSLED